MPSGTRKRGPVKGSRQAKRREARGETKGTPNVPAHVKGNGMRGAWQRGFNAGLVGHGANPYDYHQTNGATVTYARGMHRMWDEGREAGDNERWRLAGRGARENLSGAPKR